MGRPFSHRSKNAIVSICRFWENARMGGLKFHLPAGAVIREPLTKSVQLPAPPLSAATSQSQFQLDRRAKSSYFEKKSSSRDLLTVPFLRLRPATLLTMSLLQIQTRELL